MEFKDFFFTYGRRESLCFVGHLHRALRMKGYEVWFDKANIPDGEDYAERINHGIESAHNFIVVMAPRCMTSPYCLIELEYARILGKRVIPINQMSVSKIEATPLPEKRIQLLSDFYRFHDIPDQHIRTTQDVLNRFHALIGKTDWLDGKMNLTDADCNEMADWARPYENNWHLHDDPEYLDDLDIPLFGTCVDDMALVIERVMAVAERQKNYVHKHTELLFHALQWEKNQRTVEYLLVGKDRLQAEDWLLTEFIPPRQPPCLPSDLHGEFICESRKNSENMMTDVFICCDRADREGRDKILRSLSRYAITAWTRDRDIRKGDDPGKASEEAIAFADNFFFLISPESTASENCLKALNIAEGYHKRVIPIHIAQTQKTAVPEQLRQLEYIDFARNVDQLDFNRDIDAILHILNHDRVYFREHKILLCRALKWEEQGRKDSFLLRGHNLENAKTWLRLNTGRENHPPTDLHRELIDASEAKRGHLSSDVFISYSRKDGDFARKLNTALQEAGKTTWFDQESISKGVDFRKEIYKGIESSDNFLFIISPDAVTSPYCFDETDHAAGRSKRFITVRRRQTNPQLMPEHLRKIQWIDFEARAWDEAFPELIQAIDLDREHARQHTVFQQRASEWSENGRSDDFLLNKTACERGEVWLKEADDAAKQPFPADLQREHIARSRKAIEDAERAGRRRRRIAFTAVTAGLIIALVLAGIAFVQRNKAERQMLDANYNMAKVFEEKALKALDQAEAGHDWNDYRQPVLYASAALEQELAKGKTALGPASAGRLLEGRVFKAALVEKWSSPSAASQWKLINSVAFSPDGKTLASAAGSYLRNDKTVRLWDVASGAEKGVLEGHTDDVSSVAFSPDGQTLASGSDDKTVRLWDVATGAGKGVLKGHIISVTSVAFSPDGRILASGSFDNTVRLWDVASGAGKGVLKGHADYVRSVAFSPDGKTLASGSEDQTVRLWEVAAGAEKSVLRGHTACVRSVAFSPDGKTLASGSEDKTVRLWDVAAGVEKGVLKGHTAYVLSVAFSPDGKTLATGSRDETVRFWDVATGAGKSVSNGHAASILSVAFSPDGKTLASGSEDKTVRLWDVATGAGKGVLGRPREVLSVAFSPDGQTLASGSADHTVRLWDVATGVEKGILESHDGRVAGVTFSPDGKTLASGSGQTVRLWDVATGAEKGVLKGHTLGVDGVAFSPDGKTLATVSFDKTVRLWDIRPYMLFLENGKATPLFHSFSEGVRFLWQAEREGLDFKTVKTDEKDDYNLVYDPKYRPLLNPPKPGQSKFDQVLEWAGTQAKDR